MNKKARGMTRHLRIGLFGAGVVGGGVIQLVEKCARTHRLGSMGVSLEIAKVCVRCIEKKRDFPINEALLTNNMSDILEDESINCVVELMGGVTDAKTVVFAAIQAGKHVITANKALIATFLPEIQAALAAKPSVRFAYEGAVCGGIPIVHSLQSDFTADVITKVVGIMNGTTNFMLSKMEDEKADYSDVLSEAQALGFAEADPTADVEGFDVQAKIALLAKLAFGMNVPIASIHTVGISKITQADFSCAKLLQSTIKLVGTATLVDENSLAVYVSPTVVPLSCALSSVKGPGNMVSVSSQNMGSTTFAGPGAGRFPTANSVLNDIIRLATDQQASPFPYDCEDLNLEQDYRASFFIRVECIQGMGVSHGIGEAAERHQVSIRSIMQLPMECEDGSLHFFAATDITSVSAVRDMVKDLQAMPHVASTPTFMPIL